MVGLGLKKNGKKNDYISDLHDEEIEEIKYYKKLFKDVVKDFEKLGI